jgi:hypothetical protein
MFQVSRVAAMTALVLSVGCLFSPSTLAETKTCPTAEQIHSKWDLWAHGTCLRGANLWQKVIRPEFDGDSLGTDAVGPPYSQDDLDRLQRMGANYANLSFPGLFTEEPPYRVDPKVVAALDDLLAKVKKANLFAVLSFRTGPGRNEAIFDAAQLSHAVNTVWTDPIAQEAWAEMWTYAATRYGNQTHPEIVGFDLMVEPNSNDNPLKVDDPATFYAQHGGTLYDFNPLAQNLTTAIRHVDPSTPLLVQGMNYSDVDWLAWVKPTSDTHTVYALHQYHPTNYTHQPPPVALGYPGFFDPETGTEVSVDKNWLLGLLAPVGAFRSAHQVPVAFNEFGTMRWEPGAAEFYADSMDLFETEGANHAVWLWESSFPINYDEFNFRKGPKPENHRDVFSSALLRVLKRYWSRNTVSPQDVQGKF